jgi:hypothetical protein
LRTTAGSALALLIAGAFAAPAPAATLDAPGSVAAREVLAVTATGLDAGKRYAVFLTSSSVIGLPCYGRLARRTAQADEPTVFSGVVPAALECEIPDEGAQVPAPAPTPGPPSPGFMPVQPGGGYRLIVCVPEGRGCGLVPEDRVRVHVVPTGRKCDPVAFTPASDNGAFSIRARNVGCAVAREVARGAEGGELRYRRAGMRCRGIFDGARLAQTIYRCTRPGARVTFSAS